MTNLYFPISGFFCSLLLVILFFSKERLRAKETKIYGVMLLSSFIDIILVIILVFMGYLGRNDTIDLFVCIINKVDFIHYIVWPSLMTLYVFYITYKDSKCLKKYNIVRTCIFTIDAISVIIEVLLPIELYNMKGQMAIYGFSSQFVYFVAASYLLFMITILIINYKKILNKKYIPIIVLIIFMILSAIIRILNPTLIVIPTIIVYINLIMYFTIENPDLKMVNALELAKQNAERANDAKTEFLSSMSHEIRTPLNAIVGFSNSILEDETLEEAKVEAKDIIMASENLLEIVNGILDISKIEAGKMEIVKVEYRPIEIFENIKKLLIPRIGEKPIELKTNFSKDIPAVLYGDMGKVKEIITNLLTNAVKYTEKGVIDFTVSCINEKENSKLVISVEDTGRGIKPEKIDKLFTKFERLEEDRNTTLEGTGLGLAITKNLVEMMGGKIVVQSKYGSGSKFTVYLKQKIIKMVEEKKEDTLKEEDVQKKTYVDKKVLIVDDNMLNIKVATRLLKNYEIVPDTVLSGIECLEKVKTVEYDLILMDDMMPKMSGGETLNQIKEDPKFKTPVVVLTANAITGMREKYLSNGFIDYLAKPIDKLELERVLKEYLGRSKK